MVAHEIPLLEALDVTAESGGVDSGTHRQFSERWLLSATDAYQKAELLGGDPQGPKAGIVVARECPRGDPGLEGRALGFNAAVEISSLSHV
jgi:hypothetical protein